MVLKKLYFISFVFWCGTDRRPYVGKPRSDLDQHARNEKKLLIKNAIKKIQHAFAPSPEHAMCEYAMISVSGQSV